MKFVLADRIVSCEPGRRIRTVKAVSLAEEYLADHFPTFPVLPGVLMLEAMIQSASWLVWATEDFAHSLIELRRARNVTYKSFVRPGEVLEVEVQARRIAADASEFDGWGTCGGREAVKARFDLAHTNLADEDPARRPLDESLLAQARRQFALLGGPTAPAEVNA